MTKKELMGELDKCKKQLKFVKKAIYTISGILLILSAFLLGLCWGC